jgi:maltose/moltooligosaccharide transporter
MDEPLLEVGAQTAVVPSEPKLDPRRVRSFIGLSLGRLGPRAFGAVAGVFLALLVAERTDSLLMVTFALTAHRIVTWIAFPLAGRMSDRSHMSMGRRVPYMGGGLIVAGVCTALFPHAQNFWALVALLMITRLAMVAYTLPSAAITPEAFGRSRWVRAGVAVAILGGVVGLSIRLTAIATWKQDDPSTWATSYYLSAGYIIFAGLAIVLLVREVPAAKELLKDHPTERFRDTMRSVLEAPNARPLLWILLLSTAAGGAFSRAYPIYVDKVLGAGGDELSAAGIAGALLGAVLFPLSLVLAARLSRKHNVFWAAVTGGLTALAHLWVNALWQSVVLFALSGVFLGAASIALAPLYLQILPRRGGLGERIGVGFAPILLSGLIAAFLAGFAYDVVVHDYRVIWIPTAVFSFGPLIALLWVRIPAHAKHADLRHGWAILKRNLWGKKEGRELFRGDIDHHEADGAALIELIADELNPYIDRGL